MTIIVEQAELVTTKADLKTTRADQAELRTGRQEVHGETQWSCQGRQEIRR